MDQTVVTATAGRALGSRPSRRLRAEGKLPGVIYGLGKDPLTIAVDYAELRDALKTAAGLNTVIELDVDGGASETVIVRSVQRHPIKRVVTHADFMRVDLSQSIKVKVPIKLVGDASAVTNEGGMVEQKIFEIEVEVSPLNIPDEIEADLSTLTLDRRIAVSDLVFPAGVTSLVSEEISVVTPVISRAAKMGLSEDEEFAEEGADADGEDGDGEGGEAADSSDGGEE
ncbi:MAG: 50S ribosomal protein L25 [Actinomycetia bacterium]|nr:50S ribosomal protein L25 [Actinomycetes bacterium]MCP4226586.1 50S ribosomal protein L25 [Actinomycetes bacterium]MCP5030174.1 50S ribosomal protein L25 [Actinomycetes bacterium]